MSAAALIGLAPPALAGGLAPGDGSGFDNLNLVESPADGCEYCAPNPPVEADNGGFAPDWSLGLRGGVSLYSEGGDPEYELIALPSFSLQQDGIRGGYGLELSGEITMPVEGDAQVSSLTASINASTPLDAATVIEGTGTLNLSQYKVDDPLIASNPLVAAADFGGSITRELGLFEGTLRGSAGRTVNGETVFIDDTTLENAFDNTTRYGAGARLGFRATPTLTAFVDTEAEHELYDEASPSLLVKLDNMTYAARAGLSVARSSNFEAEASIGYAWRAFADTAVEDAAAVLYNASATYRPDGTLELTASLTTTFGSPGDTAGSSAELTHEATGSAALQVSPWLRLRGSASWRAGEYLGTDIETRGWGAGLGADYLLNRNTDLTADYTFERSETTPEPATDEHQLMFGVTFHR